jgi:murein DD-endopeptidase MepM/ murein hydrolase activator NlpD
MIFSPLPEIPTVTQGFGQNPQIYNQFGLDGHNGIDFDCPMGTTVYAPHDGVASIVDDGQSGYGLHLIITDANRKSALAHLSQCLVQNGQRIYQGDPVAKSGDSGFVSAPHLHWTFKLLRNGSILNADNGYEGAVDVTEFTRLWQEKDLHGDAVYTAEAQPYLSMTFASNVYLSRHA